ncbi:IBR domain-containing protein [Colletotrichum graminicola]|uniref:IBR domain-containing protein n=1 Tax=Colletotrichum graminicola (strain M1.001 / M2 / FGSC 10212) TaxID=645133 RepID=E3QIP9_COLGM|nr:IBR domain-containing protein [Colletotrichum graminicola M1.001]EFQ30659.1 IBR domain-containing protein [Colletotrichum graminicola M1.001]WDK21389.1 IBR domain-containing protein [Colletotrichum graminicola]
MSSSFFSGMDTETRKLFFTLQQEDLEDIRTGDPGKEIARKPSDSQIAFRLYESELRSLSTSFSEYTSTIRQSHRSFTETHSLVNQELGVIPAPGNKRKFQQTNEDEVRPSIEYAARTVIDLTLDSFSPSASPEPDLSFSDDDIQEEQNTCVACFIVIGEEETFHAQCDHDYCLDCIGELFKACLTGEFQFPPRCCGEPIPIDVDYDAVPAKLMKKVRDKAIELTTLDRTYCRQPTCSTFIPKESIKNDVASCPECRETTCIFCKGAEHADYACNEDEATQELLKLAEKNSWKRCPTCRALVERYDGCLHMILLSMRRGVGRTPRLYLMRAMESDTLLMKDFEDEGHGCHDRSRD